MEKSDVECKEVKEGKHLRDVASQKGVLTKLLRKAKTNGLNKSARKRLKMLLKTASKKFKKREKIKEADYSSQENFKKS